MHKEFNEWAKEDLTKVRGFDLIKIFQDWQEERTKYLQPSNVDKPVVNDVGAGDDAEDLKKAAEIMYSIVFDGMEWYMGDIEERIFQSMQKYHEYKCKKD